MRATGVGEQTRLTRILRFIEESEALKAGVQTRAERLADAVVPFSFLLAGAVWLITRNPARAASVLLVDYSCALRLATPLAVLSAMRQAAGEGLLIKGALSGRTGSGRFGGLRQNRHVDRGAALGHGCCAGAPQSG